MALRPRYTDRGPTSSKEENERIREHLKELNELHVEVNDAIEKVNHSSFVGAIESTAINFRISEIENEISSVVNSTEGLIYINSSRETIVMLDGFPSNPMGEFVNTPLSIDELAGVITLPQGSISSKVKFFRDGVWYVNPEVNLNSEKSIGGQAPTETTDEEYAIDGDMTTAFYVERSVEDSSVEGTLTYFVTIPSNSGPTKDVNQITIYPFPSMHQELLELQYSSALSMPINEVDPNVWENLAGTVDSPDEFQINRFKPPYKDELGVPYNTREKLPAARYYISKAPSIGDRYTSFKIKLKSNGIDYGAEVKTILGIRQIDFASIVYGSSGEVWFKYTVPAGGDLSLNGVSSRIVNREVVGTYEPAITPYKIDGGELLEVTYGSSFIATDVIYFKVEMDDNGSGDSPILAGLRLDVTRL